MESQIGSGGGWSEIGSNLILIGELLGSGIEEMEMMRSQIDAIPDPDPPAPTTEIAYIWMIS